jgi:hypothetical protein
MAARTCFYYLRQLFDADHPFYHMHKNLFHDCRDALRTGVLEEKLHISPHTKKPAEDILPQVHHAPVSIPPDSKRDNSCQSRTLALSRLMNWNQLFSGIRYSLFFLFKV